MNFKKIIVVLILIFIVLILSLSMLMSSSDSQVTTKPSQTSTQSLIVTPSTPLPADIDPTVAAIPARETGGNMTVTLTTKEQAFSDLFFQVPIDMQTFMVDFDYAENKFSVLILNDTGEEAYYKWRKDFYPVLADDQFILIDKRI